MLDELAQKDSTTDAVLDFARSMPAPYQRLFDKSEITEHARLAAARGTAATHVAVWKRLARGELWLCFFADDYAGLVALMSDAIVAYELDARTAHVFCRRVPGGAGEAMGLFWVRRDPRSSQSGPIEDNVTGVSFVFAELVAEQHRSQEPVTVTVDDLGPPVVPRVYYDTRALRLGEYVLVVRAPDCSGLLLGITRALFQRHAEIIASEARTEKGVALDRFTISGTDGARLSPDRLADIQQAVLSAVRGLAQRHYA